MNIFRTSHFKKVPAYILGISIAVLGGCGGGDGGGQPVDNTPNLRMDIPKSLTGGQPLGKSAKAAATAASATKDANQPCAFIGDEDDDHFRNGYKITKLLVSAIATWSCVADFVIDVSNYVAHNGTIHETDNHLDSPGYDPEDPTHYSVTDDSETQTTVRLYYAYDRQSPPQQDEAPQFYISWNEGEDDAVTGRIVIDGEKINRENRKADDPIMMRMDFDFNNSQRSADMFLRFDEGNRWAEGFRIHMVKDLNIIPSAKVYVARGLIEMKAQFVPVDGIDEIPDMQMYTVSNQLGEGAAIANFVNVSVPLELNAEKGNHLGNYLFTKSDTYFFDDDGSWDWIYKTISSSEFRGNRTTPATGGTWPTNPSLDQIVEELALEADYFTGTKCASKGDDCNALLNAVFRDGFAGQEQNQLADPGDWRSAALAGLTEDDYLNSVYPNGSNWNGAFDFSYTP